MDNGEKKTTKVLTTDDIRKHARNWTLAGDVGLLAHLEQFSENIICKTQETQKNFNALVDEYEDLYTKVSNITNQFLALQNCQFVENRVYDEETPTEEKAEAKVQDEVEQEKLLLVQYKEAVEVGIKLLDTHFQEIELPPSSDSDEDDEISAGNSVIWKPKNPYADKKFPLLIGSAEWWADDQVGLKFNEILDVDKILSESESDMESLKSVEKTMKSSSSTSLENVTPVPSKPIFSASSEDFFIFDKNLNQNNNASNGFSKDSNSLLEEPSSFLPDFVKELEKESKQRKDSLTENQLHDKKANQDKMTTIKPKKVENAFTRELMAKLASVTNKNEELEYEKVIENNKENTPPKRADTGNLFDEADACSDLFSTEISKISEKLAVNEDLLFDAENDVELFKGEKDLFSDNNLFESHVLKKPESQFFEKNNLEAPSFEKKKTIIPSVDLFNDVDDDDDALFASVPQNHKPLDRSVQSTGNDKIGNKKNFLSLGLNWNNDEGLFDSINTEIDDDFFNSSEFVDDKISNTESKIAAESKNEDKISNLLSKEPDIDLGSDVGIVTKRKETSVFDTEISKMSTVKDAFDNSFGFSVSEESSDMKINILDSEEKDDLFSNTFKEEKKSAIKGMVLCEEDATGLFAEKPKLPDSVSVSSSRSSLFEDLSFSKSCLSSVFEKDKNSKMDDDLFDLDNDSLFANDGKPGKDFFLSKGREKEKTSLFDDCDDGDDLFNATKNNSAKEKSFLKKHSEASVRENIFEQSNQEVKDFVADSGDDDLFKMSKTPTKLRESKSEVVIQSEEKLFVDDLGDYDLFCDKATSIKPKPPNTLSLRARENETKDKTVGKLTIPTNLKAKFESAAKHMSREGVNSLAAEKEEEVLNVNLQSSVLLKCPSKDRVKIPGRRRPQSRRARQEAIKNSETWDQLTSPSGSSNTIQAVKDSSSPLASYPLSPSTDEEDFFKVPELDTNFEKEDQSIFKSDLFDSSESSKLDDSLLFDGAPVLSPHSPKTSEAPVEKQEERAEKPKTDSLFSFVKSKTVSMFDSDDLDEDDENLFKTSDSMIGGSALFHSSAKEEENVRKLLFESDFDDEEDDLFKRKSLRMPSNPSNSPAVDREGDEAKNEKRSSFVDPLGLITKKSE